MPKERQVLEHSNIKKRKPTTQYDGNNKTGKETTEKGVNRSTTRINKATTT